MVSSDHDLSSVRGSINSLIIALATLTPRDLRKKVHLDLPNGEVQAIKLGWGLDARKVNGCHEYKK